MGWKIFVTFIKDAGNIEINSIIPSSYIYSGNYFGGIVTKLKAIPNGVYVFDHWEIINGNPLDEESKVSTTVKDIRKRKELKEELPKANDYIDKL